MLRCRRGGALLAAVAIALGCAPAWSAPGDLDPTFGTGGSTSGVGGYGTAGAVQADGKLLVAGISQRQVVIGGMPVWVSDFAVTRFTADGVVDTSFDGDGTAVTDFGMGGIPIDARAAAIAVQGDQKIVVAGTGGAPSPYGFQSLFELARYLPDGSLDPDFGSGGTLVASSPDPHTAYAVAIQSDGRIVVGGQRSTGFSDDAVLARFESNGAVDGGFGSGGETAVGPGKIRALLIRPGGQIVAAGSRHALVDDFLVVQLDSSGAPDAGFGSAGVVVLDAALPAGATDTALALARRADEKLLVGGYAYGRGFTIVRLGSDGALDATFGTGGIASTVLAVSALALAQQGDGRIIAAGSGYDGLDDNVAVSRFSADGVLDTSFGAGGVATVGFNATYDDFACAAFIQADEKIVVAGGSYPSALVARFESAGPHRPITGKKLLIRNPPSGATANKVVYLAKDTGTAVPATVFEDPRCTPDGSGAGGSMGLSGLGGSITIPLPCSGWSRNASGSRYTYHDASGATCRVVRINAGRLEKAVCKGAQVAYALGAAQGDVAISLTTGGSGAERVSCGLFGAGTATVVKDGSDGRTYLARDAAPPSSCP